jgi:uncharacterized protein YfcZ (UPF0381/DUF406 family)
MTKHKTPSPDESRAQGPAWLLFILTLQGQQPALRMRIWRALKAIGAGVIRDGVYLLPNREDCLAALREQSDEVNGSSGSTQILEVNARDAVQEAEFRNLFDRTHEYEKLLNEMREVAKDVRRLEPAALSQQLIRLRRDYEALARQDFFPGAAHDQAREALEDLAATATAVLSPDEPHAADGRVLRVDSAKYSARTWATRARPWADRLGSAWLVRRRIDRRAKFLWLKSPKDCPRRAVGFDFDGAGFTHVGAKVTFEVLLASFGLEADAGLQRIAALIHYLDVGGVPVAEAPGFEAVLRGAYGSITDDDALLKHAMILFDHLYAHYSTAA